MTQEDARPGTPGTLTPGGLLRTDAAPSEPPLSLPDAPDRVAAARARCGQALAARFAAAGLAYPPAEIFLRGFKHEGQLELWARNAAPDNAPFQLVHTYPIQRASGRLGPKRHEGDRQVPEGCYQIGRFNPASSFHLSLGLDYPNASDRILTADPAHPGSDIFIHGGCESVGCLAMGDAAIEEIYLAAVDAAVAGQRAIHVHLFPCRLDARGWHALLLPDAANDQVRLAFWRGLQDVYDRFEQTHRVPAVTVREDGAYAIPRS